MNRRQFGAVLAVALLGGLAGGMLAGTSAVGHRAVAQEGEAQVVTARQFRLVDDPGNLRAMLEVTDDARPRLEFYDPEGRTRCSMGLKDDGNPVLGLVGPDDASIPILLHLTGEQGIPSISLSAPSHATRVTLALDADSAPQFILSDENQVGRIVCLLHEDGTPEVTLRDAGNVPIWFAP